MLDTYDVVAKRYILHLLLLFPVLLVLILFRLGTGADVERRDNYDCEYECLHAISIQ